MNMEISACFVGCESANHIIAHYELFCQPPLGEKHWKTSQPAQRFAVAPGSRKAFPQAELDILPCTGMHGPALKPSLIPGVWQAHLCRLLELGSI